MMAAAWPRRGRPGGRYYDRSSEPHRGIHKKDGRWAEICKFLCKLGRRLLYRDDLNREPVIREQRGQPCGQKQPCAVITAQGITDANKNNWCAQLSTLAAHRPGLEMPALAYPSRCILSTTAPSGPIRSTTSGIWPMAWVEQLRQGSKRRMPCSMRFKIPSLSLPPAM